ncbi:MAG: chemotaxis protein CheW [Sulfuricurvum sp.]|nr:chemotaxis protein CheW [Sulfuricurvum sp.]MDD5386956.1 chemotaxis protein CheW [Sulfuricurvum sp.]
MTSDYIIFTIGESSYALEVGKIDRIDQVPHLTPIPNAHPFIDGLMTYQSLTAKVINFRKMTNMQTHENQILELFNQVIKDHQNWVAALETSLREGVPFTLALDPHLCRLGKWIYSYQAHDPEVLAIVRALLPVHAQLHEMGAKLLQQCTGDTEAALVCYSKEIVNGIYIETMRLLGEMVRKSIEISSQIQKLLIYRNGDGFFAIKVDAIRDIVALDDVQIKPYSHHVKVGACLRTRGVVEYKKSLVVVIDSVNLPKNEEVA